MEKDASLYEKLKQLSASDQYPFHMPGHKRNKKAGIIGGAEHLDITEIEGFDNLHHAEGILKKAMEDAAAYFGAEETHFLVNGSSAGILAAVSAAVKEGGTLLLCRNAHMSAYHGAFLRGLKVRSIYPEILETHGFFGGVTPETVEQALIETPEAEAVLLVSPTYEGIISDIRKIVEIVHSYGKIVIVDEAHGAHLGLDKRLPESSVRFGADLVVQSLHKTLPALTQTALLHINGNRVDRELVRRFLRIYQTSSPSYLLMGSIDHCVRTMQAQGKDLFDGFFKALQAFQESLKGLKYLRLADNSIINRPGTEAVDPGKLVILTNTSGYSGNELNRLLLERYNLQMEMAGLHHVIGIATVMDEPEGFDRLSRALLELDAQAPAGKNSDSDDTIEMKGIRLFAEAMAEQRAQEKIIDMKASAEAVYVYPPGIPLLLPGEQATSKTENLIHFYKENNFSIQEG